MFLKEVTEKLEKLVELLTEKIPVLEKVEREYDYEYFKLMLTSNERTAEAREASAKLQIKETGLTDKFLDLKTEVRTLLIKKELFIEISKNLRSLSMRGGE